MEEHYEPANHAAQKDTFAASIILQQAGGHLGYHLASNLGQGAPDRDAPVRKLDLFKGYSGNLIFKQGCDLILSGRIQMQQACDGRSRAQPFNFFQDRASYFNQEICPSENLVGCVDDTRPCLLIFLVAETCT